MWNYSSGEKSVLCELRGYAHVHNATTDSSGFSDVAVSVVEHFPQWPQCVGSKGFLFPS